MKLSIGTQIIVDVDPVNPYFPTGLTVSKGEQYQFKAQGKWKDAAQICGPTGWKSWWTAYILKFSRLPNRDLFYLGGNIGKDETSNFPIGAYAVQCIETSGTLYLFANDLRRFYGNNSKATAEEGGPLTVVIRRIA